ncbi:glycosyl hydrolase family 95 catalytic domain-containing protein [Micromonospora endolithica]|uniref:Glycoside hydrolase family 95 protein n=1 Tax=Micromonospora endolithica TaxID=230091 RepID=A0A3A9YZF7_9ACTN|nr:glycoside hydrolase N-terminal domain-containing protein [Micromonospora endolithica]RKN41471.1 glycoside hydrolase family 95 protein [Micromonospora endolithica]TWJ21907.1 glycosyl hydrolase family 65 [Micromonospora endolithica]
MTPPPSAHRLVDTAPATCWQDAFLAGNGEYGIMVSGAAYAERIVCNHHRYVLPNGTRHARPPELAALLPRIRELILTGRQAEAGVLLAGAGPLRWTQSYHPGFALTVDAEDRQVHDYRRVTEFGTGEVTVQWSGGRRRSFVSRTDRLVVTEVAMGPCTVGATGDLPGRPDGVRYASVAYRRGGLVFLRIRGRYPDAGGAYGFEGLTLVRGDAEPDGDRVRVRGPALLTTVLHRVDTPAWRTREGERRLTAAPGDYDTLLARHLPRHTEPYRRVSLDLGVPDADRELPVGALLDRQAASPDRLDPALLERLFHAGRYLLLSASGVLPPRLTGLWLGSWDAAWAGDFTTDANLNLQLAGANLGALPEVTAAHARLVGDQVDDWRRNARAVYGVAGLLAPSRTDGEHGHLFHLHPKWPFAAWLPGAHWLLFPLYEHHRVTGEPLGPVAGWLVEVAEFFAGILTVTGDDGRLVIVPSYSAETGPLDHDNRPQPAAVNATMDIAAARHAFRVAAELTGEDRWTALAARLPDYLVDGRGALTEWAWPGYRADDDHRHVSHLYPVWPLGEIDPDDTPALAAAAHRALTVRGDEDRSAHGGLHRALAAARLRDADLVAANLRRIVGADMFFRSLMSAHNPGRVTYNADAAHTLPAVLIEALVHARGDVVRLLPALPPDLRRGVLRGVRLPGRLTVTELAWGDGRVRVVLTSAVDRRVRVTVADRWHPVELAAGAPADLTLAWRPAGP